MNKQKSVLQAIVAIFILSIGALSCEKDSFTTKPSLVFKEASSYDVKQGDYMSFRLKLTDKEGDISDSIWIRAFTRKCPGSGLTIPYKMPVVPQKSNIDAEVDITYIIGVIDPSAPIWNLNLCAGVDTAIFRFWTRDLAGNRSDTVQIDQPILIRNN
jgi:hypothetical protein